MKKNSLLFLLVLTSITSFSQKNFTLYNLKGTPQAFYANPSFTPKAKLYISAPLGMVNLGVTNSAFSFDELLTHNLADSSYTINVKDVVGNLKKSNFLSVESNIELLGLGYKMKDMYFSFSATNKFQFNLNYPKDLLRLALEGNGSYLGERASLDGLGVNLNSYMEYAFGATKEINDKLTLGGRLKLISGIANINTKKSEIGLYTDAETFALTIDGSAEIQTANSLFYLDSNYIFDKKEIINNSLIFANKGIGIDIGGTYKINDKLSINASVLDLGSITWKTNVSNYKSNNINFKFEGVDVNELISDTSSNPGQNFQDTLTKIFSYDENYEKYTTFLNTKIYLGANYQLTKQINAGALLFNEFIKGKYRAGFSISMNASLKSWLAASMNYTIYNGSFSNIGLGLSMKGGPMQFYIMSDNVLSLVKPFDARNVHVCLGMSIFLKEKENKKKEENLDVKEKDIEIKP